MQKIRFAGLAKEAAGKNVGIISEWTGYEVEREGDDIVVPATDKQLLAGPRSVLLTEKRPLSLASEIEKMADLYVNKYFKPQFEAKPKTGPFPITVSLPYGLHSRLEEKRLAFFYSRTEDAVRKVLVTDILPFMRDEMDATNVFPLAVDFQYQLAMICLNQVGAGISQFGSSEMGKRLDQRRTLSTLMPSPMNIAAYADVMMVFAPMAVTLPFGKIASSLHFKQHTLWDFDYLASRNIFETFGGPHDPMPVNRHEDFLNLSKLGAHGTKKYFVECVNAINTLMSWLNDPREYADEDGIVNHIKALQEQSSIYLMFSDMSAINFTNHNYSKVRHVLSFLDKLANLKVARCGLKGRNIEQDVFQSFFSPSFGQGLARLLKYRLKQSYDKLGWSLSNAVISLYGQIEEGGAKSLVRSVRNYQHGPFLYGQQFEKIYFSEFRIPFELSYMPLLMMWGLAIDRDGFLSIE
ncbi:hypothetical protein [Geomonas subterranea]|uniref:hypothetical protein n=1 Tax=Geomonas subterranea TaxID=2847989 RepID=UPI001CD61751|nr:hypothetical protein [Geomonas fuzhouensis]